MKQRSSFLLLFAAMALSPLTHAAVLGHLDFDDLSSAGISGNALNIDVDGAVDSSIAPPSGSAARTFSVWFNPTDIGTVQFGQRKVLSYGNTDPGGAITLSLEGGYMYVRHYGGNFYFDTGIETEQWYHLVFRVNDGATTFDDVDVFLNNTLLTDAGSNGAGRSQTINTTADNLWIGQGFDRDNFAGLIDEVTVYDTALSDSTIGYLWENPGAVVPEASSYALFAGGLALMGALLHRRKKHL